MSCNTSVTRVQMSSVGQAQRVPVHLMPCEIEHDGPAQDRTVRLSSVFDKLTYWNLETHPNSDDTIVMAMDWPEMAEAVSCRLFF
ncbi:hypothetical protein GBF38_008005, partial [Nibea albiflora]